MDKNVFLRSCIALLLMLISASLFGQSLEWARQISGIYDNLSRAITTDASGNVYVVGQFKGTADFDPGPATHYMSSAGIDDIYILKLDASGNLLWARQFGSTAQDIGYSVITDDAGNIYVTGNFKGTVDFDPGEGTHNLTSAGDADIYILKLNQQGNLVWVRQMGGSSVECGTALALDASGNLYVAGYFYATADFDPGPGTDIRTSNGDADVFVAKLDTAGNYYWVKTFGGTLVEIPESIAVDPYGDIIITGPFMGVVDFDPNVGLYNLTSAGNYDIFVSKLTSQGNLAWVKQIGGPEYDYGRSVTTDAFGNVYVTGDFRGTTEFDPAGTDIALTSAGDNDAFIAKFTISGTLEWARQMGGPGTVFSYSLALDAAGNIYTTGSFLDSADFDPGTGTFQMISGGNTDGYILKLDASGNFVWAKQIAGPDYCFVTSVHVDGANSLYYSGYFYGTADFDPGEGNLFYTSAGGSDTYIVKMSQISGFGNHTHSGETIRVYPNPATGGFFLEFGDTFKPAIISIKNSLGQEVERYNNITDPNRMFFINGPRGLYFIEIVSAGKEIAVVKLFKL